MPGIIEGFYAQYVSNEENTPPNPKPLNDKYTAKDISELGPISLLMILAVRLFFIFIALMLWPKIMPKLFTNVTSSPTYLQLLGLSVIISLL